VHVVRGSPLPLPQLSGRQARRRRRYPTPSSSHPAACLASVVCDASDAVLRRPAARASTTSSRRGAPPAPPPLPSQSFSAGREDVWHPLDYLIDEQIDAAEGGISGGGTAALSEACRPAARPSD
jgi:hypothetical protein